MERDGGRESVHSNFECEVTEIGMGVHGFWMASASRILVVWWRAKRAVGPRLVLQLVDACERVGDAVVRQPLVALLTEGEGIG